MVATVRDPQAHIAQTLRLSITGDCNLSCFYCKPLGFSKDLARVKNLVQPSDVSKLMKIVGEYGVNRVVIGGGEPLLRKDVPNFVKAVFAHKAINDVRLVTNGTFLKTFADPLRKMGLKKVSVNFDSLNFMKYQRITGRDSLYRVLDGIEKVEKLNYSDIRLNILLLSGVNQDEVVEFARMTKDRKVHLRFVEYHPKLLQHDPYSGKGGLSVLAVKRAIDNFQSLTRVHCLEEEVQIPTYKFGDGRGRISFLSNIEIQAEAARPRMLFNAEGALFNEKVPNRSLAILADLRRDAKEVRLHRSIERLMKLEMAEPKKKTKPAPRTSTVTARRSRGRAIASARR